MILRPFIPLSAFLVVLFSSALFAETPRPNILFLIVDDMTTTMSCQKWPGAKTPNMDALAARGVRFEKAFCQFSVCNPARASFLTGCYPEKTGVTDLVTSFRDALPEVVTLPQYFKLQGYRTASVGKVFHVGDPKTSFDIVHRSPLALDQNILHEVKKSDSSDKPRKSGKGHDYNLNYASADRLDSDFTDHQIGRLIAELDRLGLTDNTFIALTGDHGYQLGEHGLWAKQTLFDEANHVPLIFAGPGIAPGVSKALVEQVDIYPTLASLAGLPLPTHLQGTTAGAH